MEDYIMNNGMNTIKYGLLLVACCAVVTNTQAFFGLFPVPMPVPAPMMFERPCFVEPIPVVVERPCCVERHVCCEPTEEFVEVGHIHTFHPVRHRRHRMRRWRPRPHVGFGFGFHRPHSHFSFNFGF